MRFLRNGLSCFPLVMLIGIACSPQAHLQVFKGLLICFSSSIVVALAFHHMKRKTIFSFFFQSLITNSIIIDVADVLHVNSKQRGRHYRKFSIKKVYVMCLILAKYFSWRIPGTRNYVLRVLLFKMIFSRIKLFSSKLRQPNAVFIRFSLSCEHVFFFCKGQLHKTNSTNYTH